MNFYILKHQISNKPLHKGRTCRANLYQAVFLFIISSIPTKLKVIICISIKANPKDVTADGLNKAVKKVLNGLIILHPQWINVICS